MGTETATREKIKEAAAIGSMRSTVDGLATNVAAVSLVAGEARDTARDAMQKITAHEKDTAIHGCPSREQQDDDIAETKSRLSLVSKGLILALSVALSIGAGALSWGLFVSNSAAAREARVGTVEDTVKDIQPRVTTNERRIDTVQTRLESLEEQRREDSAYIKAQLDALPSVIVDRIKGRRRR